MAYLIEKLMDEIQGGVRGCEGEKGKKWKN